MAESMVANERTASRPSHFGTGTTFAPSKPPSFYRDILLKLPTRIAAVLATLICAPHALASPDTAWHSIGDIESVALAYVESAHASHGDSLHVERLDKRLKLPTCSRPLESKDGPGTRAGARRYLVQINCSGVRAWKLYVSVVAERSLYVVVASRYLPRGHIISASDLDTRRLAVSGLRAGYSTELQTWVGQSLTQATQPGAVLYRQIAKQPVLVKRGQRLDLLVDSPGVTIRMAGQALDEGRKGDRIKVKNLSSNRILTAIIKTSNEVMVPTL